MTTTPILKTADLFKRFRIPHVEHRTLKARVLHPLDRTTWTEFQALADINLEVMPGEFFGIIGRNGSGKSTLLKILAGIYKPDSGKVEVNGSLSSFIELGVGFNMDLSGRDNLYINGALMGLSRRNLRKRYDSIVEFAELEDFMDMKLRNYSSGMQVRLAFTVALESGSDVLLTDEILAVGDERFQNKCFEVFRERKQQGKTVVFVSHDMDAVNKFCDNVLVLEKGRQVDIGSATEMARVYHTLNIVGVPEPEASLLQDPVPGAEPPARILGVTGGSDRADTVVFEQGEPLRINVRVRFAHAFDRPVIGIAVADAAGQLVFMTNSALGDALIEHAVAGDEITASFTVDNHLVRGAYTVTAGISPTAEDGFSGEIFDLQRDIWSFEVLADRHNGGVVDLPHTVDITWHDRHDAPTVSGTTTA